MKISSLSKYALGTLAAAGILAGCSTGASQSGLGGTSVNPSVSGHVANSVAHNGVVQHVTGAIKIIPDRKKKASYAYISDYGASTMYVYDFTKGKFGNAVGSTNSGVSGPQGVCFSKGNFWVANTNNAQLISYKAGSTTSNGSLSTTGEYPADCAADKAGDIAASDICNDPSCGPGNIDIFKGGTGSPTSVTCPNLSRYYFLAYDNKSNIFVDGEDPSGAFAFCEVPAGSSSGEAITLSVNPAFPGGVQWDGKYITVLDQDSSTVYQYSVSGTTGTEVGTVTLSGASFPVQDWITKNHKSILSSNAGGGNATSFKYPAGGTAVSTVSGFYEPIGVAVGK